MTRLWQQISVCTPEGKEIQAIAPLIISASRSTDIPALYPEWFFKCLEKGYLIWTNPFNGKAVCVSFKNTRVIVFWSKNPEPIFPYLSILDKKDINYYFLYTLNDYEKEEFEPNIPLLKKRIEVFRQLSEKVGKERVIWRFDPLVLTDKLDLSSLLQRIKNIGDTIHPFTTKLIFSFVIINHYKKVLNNFNRYKIEFTEFDNNLKMQAANEITNFNRNWNLKLASCAENLNLDEFNVSHNKCIDDELMTRIFSHDKILMNFLHPATNKTINLKDKGQRKDCNCIVSKDIGMYDTCTHFCIYCYANTSRESVLNKIKTIAL